MQQCCTENQFCVFLATALTGVLTAGTAAKLEKQIDGKGVAQLRELLPHNLKLFRNLINN